MYQDNQSAMLLEKNGKASSGRRTRHINIRYFFVTDQIKKGELGVEYCPTEEMLADFFTKPLQGSTFKKLRQRIMNLPADLSLPITTTGPQECVGASGASWADVVKGTGKMDLVPHANDIKHDVANRATSTKGKKKQQ